MGLLEDELATPEELAPKIDGDSKDPLLSLFVTAVNGSRGEIPITLFVRGTIITGTLIAIDQYYGLLRSENEWLDQVLKPWHEKSVEDFNDFKIEKDTDVDMPRYIHLKDATFIQANKVCTPVSLVWRGRLTEISGFSFETLSNRSEH